MNGNHLTVQRPWPAGATRATNVLCQWCGLVLILIHLAAAGPARADTTRSQTINLQKGWNSVFLQVSPTNRDPGAVFANTPIEIAATYFSLEKPVQYIQNPGSIGWNKSSWAVWYGPNRSDAVLSSLHAVHGNRAFLIFSKQDYTWTVSGAVGFEAVRWKGDSFNLVGFGVDGTAPPTFDQFFSTSTAHQPYRIYRLVNSQWQLVADPIRTQMHTGEAYWIYCRGPSDYQGPLRAKVMAGQGIDFGTSSDSWITFANESSNPVNIQVQTVAGDIGLPLGYTVRGIAQANMLPVSPPLPATYSLPELEAGDTASFFLKLRRELMTNPVQSTLLKITTDNGIQLWVPVTGTRTDLATQQ